MSETVALSLVSFGNSICTCKGLTTSSTRWSTFSLVSLSFSFCTSPTCFPFEKQYLQATSLREVLQKKNKSVLARQAQIKNNIAIFVNSLIENPTFDSQTKENMTLEVSAFGYMATVSDDFHKTSELHSHPLPPSFRHSPLLFSLFLAVAKTGIIENILLWAKFKGGEQLKKTGGSKREHVNGITKLDDPKYARNRSHAHECTLIPTSGDFAKTLAMSGLSVVGRGC